MLTIGEFSKLSKATIKTLRYYEEIGLFKPSHVEENGWRFYTVEDLKIITVIKKLRGPNMSIEDIKKAINGDDLIAVLRQRSLEIEEEIAKQNRDLSIIDDIIKTAKRRFNDE